MKKFNFLLSCIILMLVFMLPVQNVFADDVPLKSNDINVTLPTRPSRAPVRIAVTASLNDYALDLSFSNTLGVAQVTVEDENGSIVYQNSVDTGFSQYLSIDMENWDSSTYTLTVEYGSTTLTGEFDL